MEVLYTSPMAGATYSDLPNHAFYQWFIGDLVPMQSCAYVVNMNAKGSGATKSYSFQRLMMSIQYDTTINKKKVLLVPDAAFISANVASPSANDLPRTHIPINYFWKWRAFYWFNNGRLIIKQDSSYTQTGDPCQRDTPVFNPTGATLAHFEETLAAG